MECIARIKSRNKLRRKAKISNLQEDWDNWKDEKNKVNNMLRDEAKKNDKVEQLAAQEDIIEKTAMKQSQTKG